MPLSVVLAAAAVSGGVCLLVWVVAAARPAPSGAARGNLGRDLDDADLRGLLLERSAAERGLAPLVSALARLARRVSPVGMVESLERRVWLAGAPAGWSAERILAAKIVLLAGGAVTGAMVVAVQPSPRTFSLLVLLPGIGFLLPDVLLRARADRRQQQMRVAMPDALDQMTICVEAGLGFEAAMARVARASDDPLNLEFRMTLQEMRVGATRAEALRRMADRNDVPELRRFVLALVQAEGYGLSIASILRTQARQVRIARRHRAEEHAAKLPVKIIFPLVFCILPALFIVILGPAGIRLAEFFGG